eukprot:SAG22_NODE_2456_length_2553_cov_1.575795_2_plen_231_part_00
MTMAVLWLFAPACVQDVDKSKWVGGEMAVLVSRREKAADGGSGWAPCFGPPPKRSPAPRPARPKNGGVGNRNRRGGGGGGGGGGAALARQDQNSRQNSAKYVPRARAERPISTGCQYRFQPRFADMSPRGRTSAADSIVNHLGYAPGEYNKLLQAGINKGKAGGLTNLGRAAEQCRPTGPHDSSNARLALEPDSSADRIRSMSSGVPRRDVDVGRQEAKLHTVEAWVLRR